MARIRIAFPESKTLFQYRLDLRVTDLNYGNHLAHDTLISLLHEARSRFFLQHGHSEIDIGGVGIVVADLGISYQAEVFYPETLTVEIAVDDLGRRGCDLVYRVSKASDGSVVATAKTGIVFFDYQQRRSVSIPDAFKQMISVEPV